MRTLLIVLNFIAVVGYAGWGYSEYGRSNNETALVFFLFGCPFILAALNLGYIATTPPTYRWRTRFARFIKAWKASD